MAQGLTPNTTYTFQAKARNQDGVETPYSPAATRTTMIENRGVTAGNATTDSVEIRADGALTNLGLGSSGVYFDCTTEGVSGGIKTWGRTSSVTVTGLMPGTCYAFRLKARNRDSVETPYSATADLCTLANVPGMPALADPTSSTLGLDLDANGNSAETEFAVQCTATVPLDATWVGKYVDSAGLATDTAAWQTKAAWAATTVRNLKRATSYTLEVKARNPDGVETAFGAPATVQTGSTGDTPTGQTAGACGAGAGCSSGVLLMVPSVLIGLGWMRHQRRWSGKRTEPGK